LCTKSLPATLCHLESLTNARLPSPWEVTDEERKARDKLLAQASDHRRLRARCSHEERRSRDTAPLPPPFLEPLVCSPAPRVIAWDELLSDALRGSISLPA